MIAHAKLFAVIMIVLQGCASVGYFASGDLRRGIYWAAAAVLTGAVTF